MTQLSTTLVFKEAKQRFNEISQLRLYQTNARGIFVSSKPFGTTHVSHFVYISSRLQCMKQYLTIQSN